MRIEKETTPSRQARGVATKDDRIVTRNSARDLRNVSIVAALTLFCVLVLPRLMYVVIAPMKGWC